MSGQRTTRRRRKGRAGARWLGVLEEWRRSSLSSASVAAAHADLLRESAARASDQLAKVLGDCRPVVRELTGTHPTDLLEWLLDVAWPHVLGAAETERRAWPLLAVLALEADSDGSLAPDRTSALYSRLAELCRPRGGSGVGVGVTDPDPGVRGLWETIFARLFYARVSVLGDSPDWKGRDRRRREPLLGLVKEILNHPLVADDAKSELASGVCFGYSSLGIEVAKDWLRYLEEAKEREPRPAFTMTGPVEDFVFVLQRLGADWGEAKPPRTEAAGQSAHGATPSA